MSHRRKVEAREPEFLPKASQPLRSRAGIWAETFPLQTPRSRSAASLLSLGSRSSGFSHSFRHVQACSSPPLQHLRRWGVRKEDPDFTLKKLPGVEKKSDAQSETCPEGLSTGPGVVRGGSFTQKGRQRALATALGAMMLEEVTGRAGVLTPG